MTAWIAALVGWNIALTLILVLLGIAVAARAAWEGNHALVHDAHVEQHRRAADLRLQEQKQPVRPINPTAPWSERHGGPDQ